MALEKLENKIDWKIDEIEEMPRLREAVNHPLYQKHYRKIQEVERNREYCHHDMEHFLDVARISYIRNLELHLGYEKELIYLVALLHDIGKDRQYLEQVPHEIAGEEIAGAILRDIKPTCSKEEMTWILRAIRGHRKKRENMTEAEKLFYWSDKRSRKCFACSVKDSCNWKLEEKNMEIII